MGEIVGVAKHAHVIGNGVLMTFPLQGALHPFESHGMAVSTVFTTPKQAKPTYPLCQSLQFEPSAPVFVMPAQGSHMMVENETPFAT